MSEEGFEKWDADFLAQLIHVEELALSSSSSTAFLHPFLSHSQSQPPPPPPNNPLLHRLEPPPPPSALPPPVSICNPAAVSYSPPRELSRRLAASFPAVSDAVAICAPELDHKDQQIQRLQRELGCVSKQLSDLDYFKDLLVAFACTELFCFQKQECSEQRKGKNKKDGQLNHVSSRNEEKDGILCH